jgi:hypothetical protein
MMYPAYWLEVSEYEEGAIGSGKEQPADSDGTDFKV